MSDASRTADRHDAPAHDRRRAGAVRPPAASTPCRSTTSPPSSACASRRALLVRRPRTTRRRGVVDAAARAGGDRRRRPSARAPADPLDQVDSVVGRRVPPGRAPPGAARADPRAQPARRSSAAASATPHAPLVDRAVEYLAAEMDAGRLRRGDPAPRRRLLAATVTGIATDPEALRAVGWQPTAAELRRLRSRAASPSCAPPRHPDGQCLVLRRRRSWPARWPARPARRSARVREPGRLPQLRVHRDRREPGHRVDLVDRKPRPPSS